MAAFLSITMRRSLTSPISNLPVAIQADFVLGLFLGSCVCLYGIAMGTPFDSWRQANKLVRRLLRIPQQNRLDPRRPYRVGVCGTPMITACLAFYCGNIIAHSAANVVNITGASLIGFLAFGMFLQTLRFLMEIRRIGRTLPILIEWEMRRRVIGQTVDRLTQ